MPLQPPAAPPPHTHTLTASACSWMCSSRCFTRFMIANSAPFMADGPTEFCTRLQNSTSFPQSGSLPATLVAFSVARYGVAVTGSAHIFRAQHNMRWCGLARMIRWRSSQAGVTDDSAHHCTPPPSLTALPDCPSVKGSDSRLQGPYQRLCRTGLNSCRFLLHTALLCSRETRRLPSHPKRNRVLPISG